MENTWVKPFIFFAEYFLIVESKRT